MRVNHFSLFLFCLLLAIPLASAGLLAQPDFPLPADLIFSTGTADTNALPQTHNVLARLDAGTGQVSAFYTDESAVFLKALAWSPDGSRLAYLRVQYDGRRYSAQICVLSWRGVSEGCFDDAPVGYFSVYNPQRVTWSADGERLYFVGGDETARRLLEADLVTRKTLRIVYEYPVPDNQMDNPPVLAWTNDLAYLTLGAGDHTRVQQGLPVLLVALNGGQTVDLAHIPGTEGSSPFVVCPFFSPAGTYLTAYNFDVPETPSQPQFLILDNRGAIVSASEPAAPFDVLPTTCPAWQSDESAFYFPVAQRSQQASTLRILKYSLDNQQFSLAYDSGQLNDLAEATVISPLLLSPDEQFLAFDSPFNPAVSSGAQVTVIALTPTAQPLRRYSVPFRFSADPLWSPLTEPAS